MKSITQFENKKVLVLGLAKSGEAAARLLAKLGAIVTVNDGKPFEENPSAQALLEEGIKVVCGGHPLELLDENFELMVKNPGIRYDNPMVARALEKGIPVWTEVELAYLVSEAPIIGITGSNGKTTTTTMIADVLNHGGKSGVLSGNIGFPASEVAQSVTAQDTLVMELLNFNQDLAKELATKTKAQVVPFSTVEKVDGAYLENGGLYYKGELIMLADEIGVPGSHNVENALATIAVSKLSGVSNQAIKETLASFGGVKHRLQFVDTINDVKFYNDSKSTNILATQKALSGFDNSKVILIAGGLDRGNEFDELVPDITGVKKMIILGESAPRVKRAAEKAGVSYLDAKDVADATRIAFDQASAGDVVLLSPANASWDMYKNFEVRGDEFIATVEQLKG